MTIECPKFGTLQLRGVCPDCDCEYAPGAITRNIPPPTDRRIVTHQGMAPAAIPLRMPKHHCDLCGARSVPCFACDMARYDLTHVQNGLHVGQCYLHGMQVFPCPQSARVLEHLKREELPPPEPSRFRLVDGSTSADQPLDPLKHERMRERVAASLGVFIGFILGCVATAATIAAILSHRSH